MVQKSDLAEDYNMDVLGNFTPAAGGIKVNLAGSSTVTHAVNATNEITTLDAPNPSELPEVIKEDFTSTLSSIWTAHQGTWSISSNMVNVDSLASGEAALLAAGYMDVANYEVTLAFPTGSSTNKAGLVFSHDGTNNYYAVVLDRNAGAVALHKVTNGSWGAALASGAETINESTAYTLKVVRLQKRVEAYLGTTHYFTYDLTTAGVAFAIGQTGLYSDKTNVVFDDFFAYDTLTRDPYTRGTTGVKYQALPGNFDNGFFGPLIPTFKGEAVFGGFFDDDYMVQVDVRHNAGTHGDIWVRRSDRNNGYRIRLVSDGNMALDALTDGEFSALATNTYSVTNPMALKVKAAGSSIKVWVGGSLKFNVTDSAHLGGMVALAGAETVFENLKVGYDNNADDDIDDGGDDIFIDEPLTSTSFTTGYDHAGNMIDDGRRVYVYDAWNRLVKVRARADADLTIQEAAYDGTGRRIRKVVSNSGDLDGTFVYIYDGWKIAQVNDGSGNMVQQFIHGTQYIDELVMMRAAGRGDLYVHQDANWNVIALTDLGGSVVERYTYTPYGELTVHQVTGYGDRDGDGTVDSNDKGTPGTTCTGTVSGACRILDLDFDGDYDSADATLFDALSPGLARHPGRTATGVRQPFGHQGLVWDGEVVQKSVLNRSYSPNLARFSQRINRSLRDRFAYGQIGGGIDQHSFRLLRLNSVGHLQSIAQSSCCIETQDQRDGTTTSYFDQVIAQWSESCQCLDSCGGLIPGSRSCSRWQRLRVTQTISITCIFYSNIGTSECANVECPGSQCIQESVGDPTVEVVGVYLDCSSCGC